jgi:hypothetical protein
MPTFRSPDLTVPLPHGSQPAGGDTRRPGPVEAPRGRAPRETELVRFRLPDRPGSLAAVTEHLASHGVDVLRLEIVDRGGGAAVDDFLLAGAGLDSGLGTLGRRAIVLARRRGTDLRDPGLAMAAACEAVSSARTETDAHCRIVRAALGLVFAEAGLLLVRREGGLYAVAASTEADVPLAIEATGLPLVTSALFSGESLTADGRIPWAPSTLRALLPPGSVVVVPGGSLPAFALVLARADHAPFVTAELERLAALMRVSIATLGLLA